MPASTPTPSGRTTQALALPRALGIPFYFASRIVSAEGLTPIRCAQFCAHHQTLPTDTDCSGISAKPCWTRYLWRTVASGNTRCKLLIVRAANLPKLDVAG